MQSFQTLTSRVIPLLVRDVDTDQIIPARYLKVTDKNGLAEGLFYGWRYRADGSPDPAFPLNRPEYQGCQVLLAGDNFGCGSSREHAPWALAGWGIRAVISTSFADIFRNNALKNGLLPVIVEPAIHQRLADMAAGGKQPVGEKPPVGGKQVAGLAQPAAVTIDLGEQTLFLPDGTAARFPIDPFSKLCLLEGLDPLGYLLKNEAHIRRYEQQHGLV
jgi:3-isopropylmalate/(R)-2-methylmalate dehydratase small subunit